MRAASACVVALLGLTACGGASATAGGVPTPAGPSCFGTFDPPAWEQPQTGFTAMQIGGTERLVRGLGPERLPNPDADLAVADQAARDFDCPASRVHTTRRATESFAWGVEACGHHGAYVAVTRYVTTSEAPGHERLCLVLSTARFWRLDGDPAPALARMDAEYHGPRPAAGSQGDVFASHADELRQWVALVDQAAKDLACPRDEVVPAFLRGKVNIPVAEGCGQRATYLPAVAPPFLVQSLVRIPPP